jgi:type II secretory pathway component PulF
VTEKSQLAYSTLAPQRPDSGWMARTAAWLAGWAFWIWLGGLIVAGVAHWAGEATNPFVGAMAAVAAMLLLTTGAMLARGVRRIRDLSVLYYLEHAVRLNAPVTQLLGAAEQHESGAVRSSLGRLRRQLHMGERISVALSKTIPDVTRRMSGLVMAGENTGQVPASMNRITHRRDFLPLSDPTDSIFHRWYPGVVLAGCIGVGQLCLIFVVPKMSQVLTDFHVRPPTSLRWMLMLSADAAIVILPVVAMAILLFCGRMVAQIFTPRGMPLGPLRPAIEAVFWFTPVVATAVRSRSYGDVCFVIAHALKAGMTPKLAIAEAATASGNIILQRRVRHWAAEMLAGDDLATAAAKAGLPAVVCGMLSTSQGDEDAQEVFEFLHRYYDNRFSRTATLLRGAVMPLVAIVGGIVVLAIALGVFEPLAALMKKAMDR